MYLNLNKNYRPKNIKETFEKHLLQTGVGENFELYKKISNVKSDCEFFNEMINRFGSKSPYGYEVKISERGLIYNEFLQKINAYFNYYEYDLLSECLYVFEVLKSLFLEYWIDNKGVNTETLEKVIDFHCVVQFYLGVETIDEYAHCFIGSSYGITEFKKATCKLLNIEPEYSSQKKEKLAEDTVFSTDIDTIGKCANCGVEFHIHKSIPTQTTKQLEAELFDLLDNNFKAFPLPICMDEQEERKEMYRRQLAIKNKVDELMGYKLADESGGYYYDLFSFFSKEHGLILVDGEIQDIIHAVNKFNNGKKT